MNVKFTYACGHDGYVVFSDLANSWAASERILDGERRSLCPPCEVNSPRYHPVGHRYAFATTPQVRR